MSLVFTNALGSTECTAKMGSNSVCYANVYKLAKVSDFVRKRFGLDACSLTDLHDLTALTPEW